MKYVVTTGFTVLDSCSTVLIFDEDPRSDSKLMTAICDDMGRKPEDLVCAKLEPFVPTQSNRDVDLELHDAKFGRKDRLTTEEFLSDIKSSHSTKKYVK